MHRLAHRMASTSGISRRSRWDSILAEGAARAAAAAANDPGETSEDDRDVHPPALALSPSLRRAHVDFAGLARLHGRDAEDRLRRLPDLADAGDDAGPPHPQRPCL